MDRTDRIVIVVWIVLALALGLGVLHIGRQLLAVGHFHQVLQYGGE